jgi:hypothetical protein
MLRGSVVEERSSVVSESAQIMESFLDLQSQAAVSINVTRPRYLHHIKSVGSLGGSVIKEVVEGRARVYDSSSLRAGQAGTMQLYIESSRRYSSSPAMLEGIPDPLLEIYSRVRYDVLDNDKHDQARVDARGSKRQAHGLLGDGISLSTTWPRPYISMPSLLPSKPESDNQFTTSINVETASIDSDIPPEPLFLDIPLYSSDELESDSDIAPEPTSREISLYASDDEGTSITPDKPPGPRTLDINLYDPEDMAGLLEPSRGSIASEH